MSRTPAATVPFPGKPAPAVVHPLLTTKRTRSSGSSSPAKTNFRNLLIPSW